MNTHGSKWIRLERRHAIYRRDGYACAYCRSTELLGLDHVRPRELGGGNASDNLVTCCHICNSTRRALSLRQWLRVLRARGIDTTGLAARVRRQTRRKI